MGANFDTAKETPNEIFRLNFECCIFTEIHLKQSAESSLDNKNNMFLKEQICSLLRFSCTFPLFTVGAVIAAQQNFKKRNKKTQNNIFLL
jgi:hypothetical protein